jgi:hypothetical protein
MTSEGSARSCRAARWPPSRRYSPQWLRSSDPRASRSATSHSGFVHLLRKGEVFDVRPIILGEAMQVHDGRHRLFAAFEYVTEHGANGRFEVFWDRVH